MEDIVQEIAYHLNQARCIEKRTVGNIELSNRIFENLALRGFLKLPDPDTVTIKRNELEKLRIAHYSCEDNWYSCPKSEDGCCNDMWPKDECNCGADKHNAILETALGEKK